MTPRQVEGLRFIEGYIDRNTHSPSYDEIRTALGLASKSGVFRLINELSSLGYIEQTKDRRRTIKVLIRTDDAVAGCKVVPVMGQIS